MRCIRKAVFLFAAVLLTLHLSDNLSAGAEAENRFLDNLAMSGIPAVYNELLSSAVQSADKALSEGVVKHSNDIANLANQKVWRDKISRVSQAIGRLTAVLDAGGKVYAGQYDDAAVSAALTGFSELAGTESGKALLSAYGITPPMVSAVVVSVQVWWESRKALAKEVSGRMIQSLYGAVEQMTRSSGRKLGKGDPYPVTPENVEKVWKRILYDPSFRDLFFAYMSDVLERTPPSPGVLDSLAVYGKSLFSGNAKDAMEDLARDKLRKDAVLLKSHVAGLISMLNRAAKVREQRIVARRKIQQLKSRLEKAGSIDDVLKKVQNAIQMSGVVDSFIRSAPAQINEARKAGDFQTLMSVRSRCVDYVKNVVAWLPEGRLRSGLLSGLKKVYSDSGNALSSIKAELAESIEKSPVAPSEEEETGPGEPGPAEYAKQYYDSHFRPLLVPFDWGGTDPSVVLSLFRTSVENGEFAPFCHAAGKEPRADWIISSWQNEDYTAAASGSPGSSVFLSSIDEYRKTLHEKISGEPVPADITSLKSQLESEGQRISRRYKQGEDIYWGRNPEPPPGETRQQAQARMDRGMAIMNEARAMGQALEPLRQRLAAMEAGWSQAVDRAHKTADFLAKKAKADHDDILFTMKTEASVFSARAERASVSRKRILAMVSALELPPERWSGPEDLLPGIKKFEKMIASPRWQGIPAIKRPGEANLARGLINKLQDLAEKAQKEAGEIEKAYAATAGMAEGLALAYEDGAAAYAGILEQEAKSIEEIRRFVDPEFLVGDIYAQRCAQADKAVKVFHGIAKKIREQGMQVVSNIESDVIGLKRAAAGIREMIRNAREAELILEQGMAGAGGKILPLAPAPSGWLVTTKPYLHYLMAGELNQRIASIKKPWLASGAQKLAKTHFQWFAEEMDSYFDGLEKITPYPEENFLLGDSSSGYSLSPVTQSGLNDLKQALKKAVPGTPEFMDKLRGARIPLMVKWDAGKAKVYYSGFPKKGCRLADEYVAFHHELEELLKRHFAEVKKRDEEENSRHLEECRRKLAEILPIIEARINKWKERIKQTEEKKKENTIAAKKESLDRLAEMHSEAFKEPYPGFVTCCNLIFTMNPADPDYASAKKMIESIQVLSSLSSDLEARLSAEIEKAKSLDMPEEKIRRFYETFAAAYESRDVAKVMNLIDDDWEAADGTSALDLSDHLERVFSLFDEVKFKVNLLSITGKGGGLYEVTYDADIKGRIFSRRILHEERSRVTEEVFIGPAGVKLVNTIRGQYWYIQ